MDHLTEHAAGTRIGPYTVRSTIAHGGMGSVYLAVDEGGREVALKLLKPDFAREDLVRRRFAREARMALSVDHPHVVPVLEVGEHEGVPFLAQGFVRGGSLQERLDERGPLDVPAAVRLTEEVGGALDALHAVGLVHRDVKPGNILLDESGAAHVIDFGLAKDSQASMLTQPGQAVGSLDYMAPEQIRAEAVGAWTDVYGLACVVYTVLTGSPPFAAKTGMAVMWAHIQEPPPDPRELRPELPEALVGAVMAGLAKEPGDRPPSTIAYASFVAASA